MAGKRSQPPRFDPYAILKGLESERVTYILVGAFARVLVGADEITRGVDLTPSTRGDNLERVDRAMEAINARRPGGGEPNLQATDCAREPVVELQTDHGQVKIIPEPAGTRGYDDLRRDAERLPIGQGLRPPVASPRDLARMLAALNRAEDIRKLLDMRYIAELERELHRGLSIER
jgi:hypothetical protein